MAALRPVVVDVDRLWQIAQRFARAAEQVLIELVVVDRAEQQVSAVAVLDALQGWLVLRHLFQQRARVDLG